MEKIKLLYVDDEPDIREVVEFALEDEDFDLRLCGSGPEALECLKSFEPDLLLLDVMMPGMDGPSTLQKIRSLPRFERLPVVFCTAKARPEEIAQLTALGAFEVIRKPFDPMALAGTIEEVWRRARDQTK